MLTTAAIKQQAGALGFDLCGVSRAERHPRLARLASWIAAGHAGDMRYLAESLDERLDVTVMLPTARSVISLGTVYNTGRQPDANQLGPGQVALARYAAGDDYHDVIGGRLRRLLEWMAAEQPGLEALSCVDNGPVQERVFAEQAGLGWIGKNTCLINPTLGSWMFLAELVTNLDLDPDAPGIDQCGTCTRCLDACPTAAITSPYTVDATRCLSYVTIEERDAVPEAMRQAVQQQVYGCDICQEVCPWNRRAAESDDPAWQPRAPGVAPRLLDLCQMSDRAWRDVLRGSAMRRAGLRRLRRSLAYAAAHLDPADGTAALDHLDREPSAAFPEVADGIRWARARMRDAGDGG